MGFTISIDDSADMREALYKIKNLCRHLGFKKSTEVKIATALGELATNILVHVGKGSLKADVIEKNGQKGVEIQAEDNGPGICDMKLAMQDGYSTVGSLGIGLPGTKRLMDEFIWDKTRKVGTKITIRKWMPS